MWQDFLFVCLISRCFRLSKPRAIIQPAKINTHREEDEEAKKETCFESLHRLILAFFTPKYQRRKASLKTAFSVYNDSYDTRG